MRDPKYIEINGKTLETILEKHKHWLNEDCDGWEYMHANLKGANLCGANLSHADLRGADLSCANLEEADLTDANLSNTDLHNANFSCADLCSTILIEANLSNAKLSYANLNHANLYNADLREADLSKAELEFANLRDANLYNADISYANLDEADITNANLRKVKGSLIDFRRGKILTESIIGYKKCRDGIIVTLEIPAGAIVFSINGNKCRTNKAIVTAINDKDGNDVYRAISIYQHMSYYVGDKFDITNFDLRYNVECSIGIHFFMTKEEAEAYEF